MERMVTSYEDLPEGTQVLQEIGSMDELQSGRKYFNPDNGKLFWFLGKVISPTTLQPVFMCNEINPSSGERIEGSGEELSLPLVEVRLPDGFLKI